MAPDLLPGGGPLNGRRWAGQQLLHLWQVLAGKAPLPLLAADLALGDQVHALLQSWGCGNGCQISPLMAVDAVVRQGGLLVPDPSIGLWSLWREALAAPADLSLIGQIHTLSTVGAMNRLEELTSHPVCSWDALVCSSRAGQAVVDAVLTQREEGMAARLGVSTDRLRCHRPQLPVIPLPLPVQELQQQLPGREAARDALGLPLEADVVLWLGRLSMLSKADPAPAYAVLDRLAQQRQRPLVLVELGPDDGEDAAQTMGQLRRGCQALQFLRLGGAQPVSEQVKFQALAAADLGLSLVDNPQETFGQSVVELMAAGLPVVVSDWDGYRDLVQPGCHGFLIPSRWADVAASASVALGWQHRIGVQPYPAVSGALAQLVQLDLQAAAAAITTLLDQPVLRRAMGQEASRWARARFDRVTVAEQYRALFADLAQRRQAADGRWRQRRPAPLALDPVQCFRGFPSMPAAEIGWPVAADQPLVPPASVVASAVHQQLWSLLDALLPEAQRPALRQALAQKHDLGAL